MSVKEDFVKAALEALPAEALPVSSESVALLDAIGAAIEKVLGNVKPVVNEVTKNVTERHNHYHPGKDQVLTVVGDVVRIENRDDAAERERYYLGIQELNEQSLSEQLGDLKRPST
jgi:hypothetical protein